MVQEWEAKMYQKYNIAEKYSKSFLTIKKLCITLKKYLILAKSDA